jgi:hypothetical protein
MEKARSSLKVISQRIGRRGAFLLFLSLLDAVYAYALAFPTPIAISSPTYQFLASTLPLEVWGALWAIVGTLCFVFAFTQQDAPGYAAAMFIKVLWALVFLLGWAFADVERGYLSTAIWGAFAAVLALISTWPEPEPGKGNQGPVERAEP